jgi:hypothetical protein
MNRGHIDSVIVLRIVSLLILLSVKTSDIIFLSSHLRSLFREVMTAIIAMTALSGLLSNASVVH